MANFEKEIADWAHPDMYTNPYMPGGSRFMRNPALPIRSVFPDGDIPPEYDIASQDINYIQVPMSSQPKGMDSVLIDPMKKAAE